MARTVTAKDEMESEIDTWLSHPWSERRKKGVCVQPRVPLSTRTTIKTHAAMAHMTMERWSMLALGSWVPESSGKAREGDVQETHEDVFKLTLYIPHEFYMEVKRRALEGGVNMNRAMEQATGQLARQQDAA